MQKLNSVDGARLAQVEQSGRDWLVRLARAGFVAKAAIYLIIGGLAAQVAVGRGGATTDSQGALRAIAAYPFGTVVLLLLVVGLCGYALWRFVQAWTDPEHLGTDAKGLAQRLGYALIGVIHVGLALSAVRLISGRSAKGSSASEQDSSARLLAVPAGRALLMAIGVGVIIFGAMQLYRAYSESFLKKLNLAEVSSTVRSGIIWAGRLGLSARSIVFGLIGLFLFKAALYVNPGEAGGLDLALQTLAHQPQGALLLGVTAVGLLAYGIYMLVSARYRRISLA